MHIWCLKYNACYIVTWLKTNKETMLAGTPGWTSVKMLPVFCHPFYTVLSAVQTKGCYLRCYVNTSHAPSETVHFWSLEFVSILLKWKISKTLVRLKCVPCQGKEFSCASWFLCWEHRSVLCKHKTQLCFQGSKRMVGFGLGSNMSGHRIKWTRNLDLHTLYQIPC